MHKMGHDRKPTVRNARRPAVGGRQFPAELTPMEHAQFATEFFAAAYTSSSSLFC